MCSFMVYTDSDISKEDFKKGFEKIQYRGPDMTRIVEDHGIWGFHRLAIMDVTTSGMQPFDLKEKRVVCNGELYGFRKVKDELIKDGYTFSSDSDCEIILPLYEKYGTDMFSKLDAEFVCVIYDGKDFIAARDPIGIRPMFYGYSKTNKIAFASEAKALIDICDKVLPFPPGHYYKDGKFICYHDATKYSEKFKFSLFYSCKTFR